MIPHLDKFYLEAGTVFYCPKCFKPQARLTAKLKWHGALKGKIEHLCGKVTDKGLVTTLSRCCLTPWERQGSFFTIHGWRPPIYSDKSAQSEFKAEPKKKRFIFF